jgi:hypothetical protein
MMNRIFLTGIVLFSFLLSNAQTDTSKVEQYCQVIATPRLLSNKVTIDIDYGEEKSVWHDNRLTENGKLKKFNTVVDALNYMGMAGWTFINAYPVNTGESVKYHFAFKKLFLKSELL